VSERLALWPAIDLSEGRVVRLLQGNARHRRVYEVSAPDVARRYEAEGADGIHVVDLDSALDTGIENRELVKRVIASVKIPVEVGGGIRSRAEVDAWLHDGAQRVVLGSLPFTDPDAFSALAASRAPHLVVALDCVDGQPRIRGWTEDGGTLQAPEVAELLGSLGVRSLLVTDITMDGTLAGPNAELLASVRRAFSGEILASGGVRHAGDARAIRAALEGGAAGVVLGRALLEGFVTIKELRLRLDGAAP
jgi:phosphoribosylformimino-5-aminoimidazole carboxamide ribotide isomerase